MRQRAASAVAKRMAGMDRTTEKRGLGISGALKTLPFGNLAGGAMSYFRLIMTRVIGIVGFSGSGKTTLICRLVERLSDKKVAVIKKTHHERPALNGGKDTDRYIEAGAHQSVLVTPLTVYRFSPEGHTESAPGSISGIVSLAAETADLVIVESAMYDGDWPRLLVHAGRSQLPEPLPPLLRAVVTDESDSRIEDYPRFERDDLEAVARFVIRITA